MANKKYTFIDLFAGCGGLSEGFMESGYFRGLAHIEWELPMVRTLRNRLVKKWHESDEQAQNRVILFDIQRTDELLNGNWTQESKDMYEKYNSLEAQKGLRQLINGETVDLIIGGPPCQAYSIHGRATDKNSMQDDYRNYLFESFVKVVDNIKPKAFIFENVTGMLSAKPGGKPVVERIYKAVSEIGYTILEPQKFKDAVYNAFDYSVPQNRERVILCGVKNGSGLSITDFYDALSNSKSNKHLTVRDTIGGLPPIFPLKKIEKVKGRNVSHYATDETDPFHLPRHCSSPKETSSDDKKLGYFFCKPSMGSDTITEDKFVGKVLFYLWNDVFKDGDISLFKVSDEPEAEICFDAFYGSDNKVNIEAIRTFLVGVVGEENIKTNDDAPIAVDVDENGNSIDYTKYSFDGKSRLSKKDLGHNIVMKYINEHSDKTFAELQSDLAFDDTVDNKYRYKGVLARAEEITGSYTSCFGAEQTSSDGVKYKVLTWWNKYNIDFIIKFAKAQGWAVNTVTE